MATLTKQPETESRTAEKRETDMAKWQHSRVLLAVAALCAGLSIAVPAVLMEFVYPLKYKGYIGSHGEWIGDAWKPYVSVGVPLSVAFGIAGIVLAILGARSWGKSVAATGGANTKTSQWMTAVASLALILAMPTLVFAPVMSGPVTDVNWGAAMILAGLALIALAVLCILGSDPAITRRWLAPFEVGAFLIALLGNVWTLSIFGVM